MVKLQQGQVWKCGDNFVRIVELHRLEVNYKEMKDLQTREGTHHHLTKKEFCRMIKGGTLLDTKQMSSKPTDPDSLPPSGADANVNSAPSVV